MFLCISIGGKKKMRVASRGFLQRAMEVKYLADNVEYIINNTDPLCWICKKKNCKNCPLERLDRLMSGKRYGMGGIKWKR